MVRKEKMPQKEQTGEPPRKETQRPKEIEMVICFDCGKTVKKTDATSDGQNWHCDGCGKHK